MQIFSLSAVAAGMGAAAVEIAYFGDVRPLRGTLGIQLFIVLLVCWLVLAVEAFSRKERRARLVLLPIPLVLVGPLLVGLLFVGCAINSGQCP